MIDNYPVTEIFESPQGEGQWAGTLMTFVRLAGCTVGKPFGKEEPYGQWLPGTRTHHYQEKCTAWDGKVFACDTDYRMKERMTADQIGDQILDLHRVVLTGGEPLMHNLIPLLEVLRKKKCHVHVETSGTLPLYQLQKYRDRLWTTVSPKAGYLQESLELADEIKVLVGPDFDETVFDDHFNRYYRKVWLQPINGLDTIDKPNLDKCVAIQKRFPEVRLSIQLHKILGVR